MYNRLILFFLLTCSFNSYSQKLLKDIASSDASSSIIGDLNNSNNYLIKGDTLFFLAQDTSFISYYGSNKNIWYTNGTTANTKKVTHGNSSNQPSSYKFLSSFKGKIYYKDYRNTNLYATNGNDSVLVKTFPNSTVLKASAINGWLYVFVSNATANSLELWKTDGTVINTTKVTDIYTGTHSLIENIFFNAGDKIYFGFSNSTSGVEPWVTDGTAIGTKILKDIASGSASSYPSSFEKVGNTVFFVAPGSDSLPKVWKTDGTEIGTVVVVNELDGTGFYIPRNLINYDNYLYFTANNRLYKTDGNIITSVMAGLIVSGNIVKANNLIYFIKQTFAGEFELWKSDGSTAGTEKIKSILTPPANPNGGVDVRILPGASRVYIQLSYFANSPFENITQHWVSNGTTAGTINIQSLNPGFSTGAFTNQLAVIGDTYYFSAYDAANGFELWKTNGTSMGTLVVKNVNKNIASSEPKQFVALNNDVFFSANDIKYGREVWKTDGTTANTQLLMDYNASVGGEENYSSYISGMIAYNDLMIAYIGADLVRFNQTTPPTPYFSQGLIGHPDPEFINFDSKIFYKGYDRNTGRYELYVTDGYTASKVKDVSATWDGGGPTNFLVLDGLFYFSTEKNTRIWKSDGTEMGTVLVKNFSTGGIRSKFYKVNGQLIFVYEGSTYGRELWKTDGTEAGTVLVKDIVPGTEGSGTGNLLVYNNSLFFTAYNGSVFGLFKSDGSDTNTQLFSTIASTNVPVVFKEKIFFLTYEFTQNSGYLYYLWSTDGTSAPIKVKQVGDNTTQNAQNIQLVNINNRLLVFNIVSNSSRIEMWASDGTSAGTQLAKVIRQKESKEYDMNIKEYLYHNNKLYFAVDDGIHGKELWVWDFNCPEFMILTNPISQDIDFKVDKYILGSNKINAGVQASYNANKYITLNPGFETQQGTRFTATMGGCINVAAASNTTTSGPIFHHSPAKGTYKPTIVQFLNDPLNVELLSAYIAEKGNHNEQNIAWIIDESPTQHILKMRIGEKEWVGYLPK